MKTTKNQKHLKLNKSTVSSLNEEKLFDLQGGLPAQKFTCDQFSCEIVSCIYETGCITDDIPASQL